MELGRFTEFLKERDIPYVDMGDDVIRFDEYHLLPYIKEVKQQFPKYKWIIKEWVVPAPMNISDDLTKD